MSVRADVAAGLRDGVVFNALALRPGGSGVQTYIRELLAALPDVCRTPLGAHVQRDAVDELPDSVRSIAHPIAAGTRRALTGLALPTRGARLCHGLDTDLPLRLPAAAVATVHDLSVFDVPDAYGARRVAGKQRLAARAIRRADVLIAVSAFTAGRIAALFGREARVVPLAPASGLRPPSEDDVAAVRSRYDLPERCVVQLATVEPRKDVAGLAAACSALDVPLVLAGGIATGSRVPRGVRHLGYVPERHRAALYGAATAVAYCSRYEGFGLPAVEAMACGAAVVATAVGGITEACRDGALVVASRDTDAIAQALRSIIDDHDLRADLRRRAIARAATLTWSATAAATAEIYRELGVDG